MSGTQPDPANNTRRGEFPCFFKYGVPIVPISSERGHFPVCQVERYSGCLRPYRDVVFDNECNWKLAGQYG